LAFAREGFTPAASDTWRAAGWHLDDALPWFAARFEPTPALTWRDNGFEPAEADAWRREHFGVRQAIEWRRLGDTPARARLVERQFADARVTVTEGLQWLDLGFSVEEICAGWPKMATGQDARSWRAGWNGIGLTPAEVSAWHTKFDHDETRRWLDAGVRDASSAATLRARGFGPEDLVDAVPVTRDDLLSAAGQIARAGGSPEIGHRLQRAAEAPRDVGMDVIEDVVDELQRLGDEGRLGAPTTARALARRFERGLLAAALRSDRTARMDTAQAT
jgi:hypothetical protein